MNTWEACYFSVDQDKVLSLIDSAADVGIELLVFDDGWFGKRNDDSTSLGDWFINKEKFPKGFTIISQKLSEKGMKLGIWLEPEMVSPESNLYREHPDWCLHIPGKKRTEWRNQLVLDLTQKEVRDFIIPRVSSILDSGEITYVKWNFNRRLTEVGSCGSPSEQQGEIYHRYILSLYEILHTLTTSFPQVVFENCASGGGRFDPGMLYYFPLGWLSDNTDAVSRLKILYGSSLSYPISSFRSHVTAVPNHQLGRTTPLSFRLDLAMLGILGFELSLTKLSKVYLTLIKNRIAFISSIEH